MTCLQWLGSSKYIATGCVDGKVRIWNGVSGVRLETFHGHVAVIEAIALSSDKNNIISVSLDSTACVFDISNLKLQIM